MINTTRKFASLLVLTLVCSAVAYAQAGSAVVPNKIGVINIQGAIVGSNEGRRDFEALSKKFEPKQAELKTLNDEVESLKKQLTAQQDKLNEDERATRVRVIEQKQKSLQRALDDAQGEFQTQQNELANRIGNKMVEVIDKYAKANNLAVIIDVSSQQTPVLWRSEQVDITPAIVEAYNTASGVAAPPASAPSASRPSTPPASRPSTTTPARKPATSGTTPPPK
jgi:outer membrane protein